MHFVYPNCCPHWIEFQAGKAVEKRMTLALRGFECGGQYSGKEKFKACIKAAEKLCVSINMDPIHEFFSPALCIRDLGHWFYI